MRKIYLVQILLMSLISSCGSNSSDPDSKVEIQYVELVDLASDSLLNASVIFTEFNNNIITTNSTGLNQLHSIYSISGDSLKYVSSALYRGRGRDEVLNSKLYKYDNNLLITTDNYMTNIERMIKISNVEDLLNTNIFSYETEVPKPNDIWRIAPIDSVNFLVTFAGIYYDSMFGILNIESQTISELDIQYPFQDKGLKRSSISSISQGFLQKRNGMTEYLYSLGAGLNVFKFAITDGEVRDMKILCDSIPRYKVKEDGDYAFYHDDQSSRYIPAVSDTHIYLLKAKVMGDISANSIEVYDWDFNLIKKIILNKNILYMSVSSDNKRIYTASYDDQAELIFSYFLLDTQE